MLIPGHSGIAGNEAVDVYAGETAGRVGSDKGSCLAAEMISALQEACGRTGNPLVEGGYIRQNGILKVEKVLGITFTVRERPRNTAVKELILIGNEANTEVFLFS